MSTQRSCRNGSAVTQKKILKWIVYLETMDKRYWDLTLQLRKKSGAVPREKKCSKNNVFHTT